MTTPHVTATPRNDNGAHLRILGDWVLRFSGAFALAAAGFLLSMLLAFEGRMDTHEKDLVAIHANRFTAQDGSDVQRQLGTFVTRAELAETMRGIRADLREIRTLVANGN